MSKKKEIIRKVKKRKIGWKEGKKIK